MEDTSQMMREQRMNVQGKLLYRYNGDESGAAHWQDVSRVGAKLRLGRYLRPGRNLVLEFASPLVEEGQVQLPARVIWCRLMAEGADFVAGVQIRRERPEYAVAFAALGYSALDLFDSVNITAGSEVSSGVWPHFRSIESAASEQAPGIRRAV